MDEIKISPEWGILLSFEYLVENSRFAFTYRWGRLRLMIVIKEPVNGMDLFEIDNDRYGLICSGESRFADSWGSMIVDSSKEVVQFVKDFFEPRRNKNKLDI